MALPISKTGSKTCAKWLTDNFGGKLQSATQGKAYQVKHLCAIVCQETAYKWLEWLPQNPPAQTIIERSVFDASGDYPGTSRSAFPVNTAAFRNKYGNAFTDMLIEEANLTRRLQNWSDKDWVYKGYGIFQYDLQHVKTDEDFFRGKGWYSFDACLTRVCSELDGKLIEAHGDLWDSIRRYNGSGPRAEEYRDNVKVFTDYCAEAIGA